MHWVNLPTTMTLLSVVQNWNESFRSSWDRLQSRTQRSRTPLITAVGLKRLIIYYTTVASALHATQIMEKMLQQLNASFSKCETAVVAEKACRSFAHFFYFIFRMGTFHSRGEWRAGGTLLAFRTRH
jgi:hypothetical protein